MFASKIVGFVAALCVTFCLRSHAQDIAGTQRLLLETQQKLGQIRMLLPALDEGFRDTPRITAVLESASEDLRALRSELTKIETDLNQKLVAGFAGLPEHRDITWKVAPRHQEFLAALPGDVTISDDGGVTVIKKRGIPLNRPVAPSPTYHVCPSIELGAGDRLSLTISIPTMPSRGGTPVPYYGLRDAKGNEWVLGFLVDSGEQRTLWIQCLETGAMALADGKLERQGHRAGDVEPAPPLFVFFHLNDTAQLNIHELRLSRAAADSE